MQAIQISLTPVERDLLVEVLRDSLGDRRVEVRRTEFSAEFHDQLVQQEQVVRGLLEKIGRTSESPNAAAP